MHMTLSTINVKSTFELLQANVNRNQFDWVKCHSFALGNEEKSALIFEEDDNRGEGRIDGRVFC